MGAIFNTLFYEPIYNILVVFYHLFGDNLGLAIIGIAVAARAMMTPLTLKQIKMAKSSQEFAEKRKEVTQMYKDDKEKQKEEMMKLSAEYLPAQLGGCLPMIFQFIFFITIYQVIRNLISEGGDGFNSIAYGFVEKLPDGAINGDFFGIWDLTKSASDQFGDHGILSIQALPYILLIVGVGVSQYGSMKIMTAMRKNQKGKKDVDKKKKTDKEDFSEIMQQSTQNAMLMMPVFITFIAYGLPSGLSLYWITQSGFVIIQQVLINFIKGNTEIEAAKDLNKETEGPIEVISKKKKKKKKKNKKA